MRTAQNPYDAVAYPSLPFPHTHPDRLAALATLHGLSPTPVERCRVLEIACGDGANLIPMAYAIPGSEFVGFDLAGSPIERGQARIGELGLKNIRLFQADLLAAGKELGEFDYIIAHGLYAWVPQPVRDRLLSLTQELLTPDGVAFISYNALPGGYLRKMVREMMLLHTTPGGDVEREIPEAMGLARFLIEARPESDAYRMLLGGHLDKMEQKSTQAVFHDELSEPHHPVYFLEFMEHATQHGLQYLCEAALPPPPDPCYRPEIRPVLDAASGGNLLRFEQMLDFARARKYRETLLCKAGHALQRDYPVEQLRRLRLASQAVSSPGEEPGTTVFTSPSEIKMEVNHPGPVALMTALEEAWPRSVSLEDLEPRLKDAGFTLDAQGVSLILRLAVGQLIGLHAWSAPAIGEISARPKASACSRQELLTHIQATTLLHSTVRIDEPMSRRFLCLLDGTRDVAQVAAALKAEFPAVPPSEIDMRVLPSLEFFRRAGFLEA